MPFWVAFFEKNFSLNLVVVVEGKSLPRNSILLHRAKGVTTVRCLTRCHCENVFPACTRRPNFSARCWPNKPDLLSIAVAHSWEHRGDEDKAIMLRGRSSINSPPGSVRSLEVLIIASSIPLSSRGNSIHFQPKHDSIEASNTSGLESRQRLYRFLYLKI